MLALLLTTAMTSLSMLAQTLSVRGVVLDENGEGAIGATVMEKGTTNGVVTDIDGNFEIQVPAAGTLTVSYVGYKALDVKVAGNTNHRITLVPDDHQLTEAVVIGYGTMKKSDLVGAVGSLAAKDMDKSPVANIGQAIQGKIAGLQVVDAGKPGDNVNIKIRGLGSINNCDPLVVIDGVPTIPIHPPQGEGI